MDTEQTLEPLNEGSYNVVTYPGYSVSESVFDTLPKASRNITATFFNLFGEILLNVSPHASKERTDELYTSGHSCTQRTEDTLCYTRPVNACEQVFNLLPKSSTQFRPVILVQPFKRFIKCSDKELSDFLADKSPVQFHQTADDNIRQNGKPLDKEFANVGEVHFLKCIVQQFGNMRSNIGEVDGIQQIVSGLHCAVHAPADFATHTSPVNAVNDFIDLAANQCTQGFPIGIFKRLFQLIGKLTHAIVNGKFLKHGTVVSATATTATAGIILLHDDVQFINARGSVLDFLCGLRRSAASTSQGVPVGFCVLLRSRKGGSAGQPGEQHIDIVQQGYNFANQKVDCWGNGVDDRRSHSTQTVLEIGSAGSQTIHALCESTAHEIAVLVEVVNTLFHCLNQFTQGKTDKAIHGNTLDGVEKLSQLTRCSLCGGGQTVLDTGSDILNGSSHSSGAFLEHISHCSAESTNDTAACLEVAIHFLQVILQPRKGTASSSDSVFHLLQRIGNANNGSHFTHGCFEKANLMCRSLRRCSNLLHTACGRRGVDRCFSTRGYRCNARLRNGHLRNFHISDGTKVFQRLAQIFQLFNVRPVDTLCHIYDVTKLLCNVAGNLYLSYLTDRLQTFAKTFHFVGMKSTQHFVQPTQGRRKAFDTLYAIVCFSVNLKFQPLHRDIVISHRSLPLLSSFL